MGYPFTGRVGNVVGKAASQWRAVGSDERSFRFLKPLLMAFCRREGGIFDSQAATEEVKVNGEESYTLTLRV